jgi:hypothetical protein
MMAYHLQSYTKEDRMSTAYMSLIKIQNHNNISTRNHHTTEFITLATSKGAKMDSFSSSSS